MAPIPENNLSAEPDHKKESGSGYWSKANIALTIVFGLVSLAIILATVLFFLYRRAEKKKLEHRKSDKAGLLENEDKTNMFSRQRGSSLTLYVDSETDARNKRSSADTMHLVPLQVTPVEESRDPIATADSAGTGISALSRESNGTLSTMMLSPMGSTSGEHGDLSVRPTGRARSTSTASQKARYYETTPMNEAMPPIPKIVHTASP
jgi:cbb3-type cytochrome oxidase subunit 3